MQKLFDQGDFGLAEVVVDIVKAVSECCGDISRDVLMRNYPVADQEKFSKQVVEAIGYDFNRGRLDPDRASVCHIFGRDDVRITTRYDMRITSPMALMGCGMHEAGHAMYEQNTAVELVGTPLAGAAPLVSMRASPAYGKTW